jgi:hypothetical protein
VPNLPTFPASDFVHAIQETLLLSQKIQRDGDILCFIADQQLEAMSVRPDNCSFDSKQKRFRCRVFLCRIIMPHEAHFPHTQGPNTSLASAWHYRLRNVIDWPVKTTPEIIQLRSLSSKFFMYPLSFFLQR